MPCEVAMVDLSSAKLVTAAVLTVVAVTCVCPRSEARFGYNPNSDIGRIGEKVAREEIASLKLRGVKDDDVAMLPVLRKLALALGQQLKCDDQERVLKRIVALDVRFPNASTAIEKIDALKELADFTHQPEQHGTVASAAVQSAESLYSQALEIAFSCNRNSVRDRTVELHSRLASIAGKRKEYRKAETHYRAIDSICGGMEHASDWPDSLLDAYGDVLFELKEYDKAAVVFKRLIVLDKSRPAKYDDRILGDMVKLAGCFGAGKQMEQFQISAEAILQLAKGYHDRHGNYLRRSWKDALLVLGELLEKNRQFSRAERAYRLCLSGE